MQQKIIDTLACFGVLAIFAVLLYLAWTAAFMFMNRKQTLRALTDVSSVQGRRIAELERSVKSLELFVQDLGGEVQIICNVLAKTKGQK